MRTLICRVFGHRWITPLLHVRRYYTCSRCSEPGFWIEDAA